MFLPCILFIVFSTLICLYDFLPAKPLLKLLSSSKDTTWLRLTKRSSSVPLNWLVGSPLFLMLPGVWQVMKPELWKSLKFLRNMWILVYFSAQAGRMDSCQDAALSVLQQEGQDGKCEREEGPDLGRMR